MKRFLVFLTALLIFVGCSTEPPQPDATDWCYIYDFTTGFTVFNIEHGQILHLLGIIPDSENVISFSYGYDRFVEPLYVIPTIVRAPTISGDITIDAAGVVYGVSASFQAVLPGDLDSASPTFEQTEIGTAGNSINVTLQATQAVILTKLEIRGMGSNPFERNDCDKSPYQPTQEPTIGTPSPVPTLTPSLTASPVPSATSTGTPTETYTPTPTPTNVCLGGTPVPNITITVNDSATSAGVVVMDDIVGEAEYLGYKGFYQVKAGNPTYDEGQEGWEYTLPYDITINQIVLPEIYRTVTHQGFRLYIDDVLFHETELIGYNATGSPFTYEFEFDTLYLPAGSRVKLLSYNSVDNISSLNMYYAEFISDNSGCDTPTPTPTATDTPNDATNTAEAMTATASSATPTAVATQTLTLTPSDGYVCFYNFLDNYGGFTATNGTFDEGGDGWLGSTVGGSNVLQINKTIGSTQVNGITLTWIVEIPAATLIISSPYGPASSINVTAGTRIQTQSTVKTAVTSLAFSGGGSAVTGKRLRLTRAEIRGSGTRPTGASCQNPTPTPVGSRTPLPSVTPRPATRTPIPPPPQFVTATSGGPTITPGGVTLTPDGTGTAVAGTMTAVAGTGAGQAGEGLGTGVGVGNGFGNLLGDWLGQAGANVGGFINSFLDAAPQPIPGIPLCMSNPTESDWCAIIYIIEWTIIAPGTPGELIIPMLQIMMNVFIVIYFAKWVLKIVRRGESVTDVG